MAAHANVLVAVHFSSAAASACAASPRWARGAIAPPTPTTTRRAAVLKVSVTLSSEFYSQLLVCRRAERVHAVLPGHSADLRRRTNILVSTVLEIVACNYAVLGEVVALALSCDAAHLRWTT